MQPAIEARAAFKRTPEIDTVSQALDYLRFDAVAELAEVANDLTAKIAHAAASGDPIKTKAYLSLLSHSVANALRIAIQLGSAEARA